MTPTRAVFRQIFFQSKQIMDTYDYLPDAEAKYPFSYVSYGDNNPLASSDLLGTVSINVHWFGEREQVSEIDTATAKLHDDLLKINSFLPFHMSMSRWRDRPQPEAPDAPGILHFVAEIQITYTRKEV